MKRLTYGVFATVLKMCCNGYQPNKKGNRIVPQKKLNGTLLKSVNPNYDVTNEDNLASMLFSCDKGVPGDIIDGVNQTDPSSIANYFRQNVSLLIDPNKRQIIVNAIKAIIKDDQTIKDDTVLIQSGNLTKRQIINTNTIEFFEFISGIFIYCINTTNNTEGKDTLPEITYEYLESFSDDTNENTPPIQNEELHFTSSKLTVNQVMDRLNVCNIKERISMWERLDDTSSRRIFSNKEFFAFFADRIADTATADYELIAMLEMMGKTGSKYKKTISNSIDFISLLNHSNDMVCLEAIKAVTKCKIRERELVDFLISFLQSAKVPGSASREFERYVVDYFRYTNLYFRVSKEDIISYCVNKLKQDVSDDEAVQLITVLIIQQRSDKAIKYFKELSSQSERMKENIISALAWLGDDNMDNDKAYCNFYLRSPRLKVWLKDFIIEALHSDDDIRNSNIIYALIITEIFPDYIDNEEFWMIINGLDDYSLQATLERWHCDLHVESVFTTDVDIRGFKNLLQRHNTTISDCVFDILAYLNNSAAIEILVANSYVPKYYNVNSIILTLIESMDIKKYKPFYLSARSVCLDSEYIDKVELLLIAVADYMVEDINGDQLIEQMLVSLEDVDFCRRNAKRNLRRLCEIFNERFKACESASLSDAIKEFVETNSQYTIYKREASDDEDF